MSTVIPSTPGNPFAPPKAALADVTSERAAPPLWSPNVAANWSLLFSPAFGAYLHMKNWQALGEDGKARSARNWVIATLTLLLVLPCLGLFTGSAPLLALNRPVGFFLLIGWYFGSARFQARLVKAQYGTDYPRRGWLKPLGAAIGVMIGCFFVVGILAALVGVRHPVRVNVPHAGLSIPALVRASRGA